jgi:hypothetical protein
VLTHNTTGKKQGTNRELFTGDSSGNIDKTDLCEQEFLPQDASIQVEANAAKIYVNVSDLIRNTQWEITLFLLRASVFTSMFALRLVCATVKTSQLYHTVTGSRYAD